MDKFSLFLTEMKKYLTDLLGINEINQHIKGLLVFLGYHEGKDGGRNSWGGKFTGGGRTGGGRWNTQEGGSRQK